MRMGTVVGRVTLSVRNPRFQGERLLLTLPWKAETFRGENAFAPAIVVYDDLGANVGQRIAISGHSSRPCASTGTKAAAGSPSCIHGESSRIHSPNTARPTATASADSRAVGRFWRASSP